MYVKFVQILDTPEFPEKSSPQGKVTNPDMPSKGGRNYTFWANSTGHWTVPTEIEKKNDNVRIYL